MIPKLAIEKAFTGGYPVWGFEDKENIVVLHDSSGVKRHLNNAEVVLDPTFWQALGKALGWAPIGEATLERGTWFSNAHGFYSLILIGGDTAKFWEEILQ